MMLVPTFLAISDIHGVGLFAAAPIAKGAKVWEHMAGLEVTIDPALLPSYPQAVQMYLKRYCYPHPLDAGKWVLDGDNGRFYNHDEKSPNCDFTQPLVGVALRDIAKGEELTCNYNDFDPGFEFI